MTEELIWFPFQKDHGRFLVPGHWRYARMAGGLHLFTPSPPASGWMRVEAADGPPSSRGTCEQLLAEWVRTRSCEEIQSGVRMHRKERQTEEDGDVFLHYEWSVVRAIPPNRLRYWFFLYMVDLWEAAFPDNCAAVVRIDWIVRNAEYSRDPPAPGPHAMLVNLST